MRYSKSLKKSELAKRVLLLMGAALLSGFIVGGLVVYAATAFRKSTYEPLQDDLQLLVYGAYDDRCITEEVSLEWESDKVFTRIDCGMPDDEQEFTFYLCNAYNVDFALVMAIISCESNFDPDAVSPTNDYGYMQINAINHGWLNYTLGVTDFTDPYENIRAGVFVIRKLFERYQDVGMVLMAYNMGEDSAKTLWSKGVYSTRYTEQVLDCQQTYTEEISIQYGETVESN